MIFFTSDAHFLDYDTIVNDNRPFKLVKECDNFLIKTWNKQAGKNDTIYFIGDFVNCDGENSTSWQKSINYVKRIKAQVVLIIGNNEQRVIKYFFNDNFNLFKQFCIDVGFKDVLTSCEIDVENYHFNLVHKPKDCKKGMLNLFGHMHRSGGLYKPFGFNIGCDLNFFRLYSQKDILHLIYMKNTYWDKDKNLHLTNLDGV